MKSNQEKSEHSSSVSRERDRDRDRGRHEPKNSGKYHGGSSSRRDESGKRKSRDRDSSDRKRSKSSRSSSKKKRRKDYSSDDYDDEKERDRRRSSRHHKDRDRDHHGDRHHKSSKKKRKDKERKIQRSHNKIEQNINDADVNHTLKFDESLLGPIYNKIPKDLLDAENDYFTHNGHLSLYLHLIDNNVHFEDLSSDQTRQKFKVFVNMYNEGKLPTEFYNKNELEIRTLMKEKFHVQNSRTNYSWNVKTSHEEQRALEIVKKGVQKQTNYSNATAKRIDKYVKSISSSNTNAPGTNS